MEDNVCEEKHKSIDEKLEKHDAILKEHTKQIENLSNDGREYKVQIQNLCCKIDSLISTFKWGIGITGTGIVAFFFWMLQSYLSRK